MRRDPLFAVTATLTLAAAIGAGTTVFSLVDTILLRPLPFPDAGRVYWLAERMGRNPMEVGLGPDYYSLRARKRVFAEVDAYDTLTVNWSGGGRPEQLDTALATPSFFSTLGVRAASTTPGAHSCGVRCRWTNRRNCRAPRCGPSGWCA
jgi:hypothetical protein